MTYDELTALRDALVVSCIFALVCLMLMEKARRGWRHHWEYHNPFNRRCRTCGRHEVSHYYTHPRYSFWEVWDHGDGSPHWRILK